MMAYLVFESKACRYFYSLVLLLDPKEHRVSLCYSSDMSLYSLMLFKVLARLYLPLSLLAVPQYLDNQCN